MAYSRGVKEPFQRRKAGSRFPVRLSALGFGTVRILDHRRARKKPAAGNRAEDGGQTLESGKRKAESGASFPLFPFRFLLSAFGRGWGPLAVAPTLAIARFVSVEPNPLERWKNSGRTELAGLQLGPAPTLTVSFRPHAPVASRQTLPRWYDNRDARCALKRRRGCCSWSLYQAAGARSGPSQRP
jgi:hypothetical protein